MRSVYWQATHTSPGVCRECVAAVKLLALRMQMDPFGWERSGIVSCGRTGWVA